MGDELKPCPSDVKRDLSRMKLRSREQERVRGAAIKLIEHQEQTIVRQRKQLADLNRRAPVEVSEAIIEAALQAEEKAKRQWLEDDNDSRCADQVRRDAMRAALVAALGEACK